jgi:hypothetical protein
MTCIDQRIILAYVQILLNFRAICFKFHYRINQRPISFQSAIPRTAQEDIHFYASWRYVKLCPNRNKHSRSTQGAYFHSYTWSANQSVKISQGLPIDVPNNLLYFLHMQHHVEKVRGSWSMLHTASNFQHAHYRAQKARGSLCMCSRFSIWLAKFSSMVWLDP